jgi:hypothetical protein
MSHRCVSRNAYVSQHEHPKLVEVYEALCDTKRPRASKSGKYFLFADIELDRGRVPNVETIDATTSFGRLDSFVSEHHANHFCGTDVGDADPHASASSDLLS